MTKRAPARQLDHDDNAEDHAAAKARFAAAAVPEAPAKPQSIVHKPGDKIEFAPGDALGIKYFFKVLDLTQRAAYRRDIVARRGVIPDQETMNAVLRDGIETAFPEPDREAALALLDEADDWRRHPDRWTAPEGAKDGERIGRRLTALQSRVRRLYRPYPEIEADAIYARDINQVIVLQHTLAGWEGVDADFKIDAATGLVEPDSLMAILGVHLQDVITAAHDVVRLSQATIKN